MTALEDVLGASMWDPGDTPTTGPALVDWAGGRRAMVREISGMAGPPRKGDFAGNPEGYRAANLRWRSASRRVQRWDDGTRAPKLAPDERAAVRQAAADAKRRDLFRNGARMRIHARVRIDSPKKRGRPDTRTRWMPAAGLGVFIPPEAIIDTSEALEDGEPDRASFDLLSAFGESYGLSSDVWELEEVLELKIWPEGEAEP